MANATNEPTTTVVTDFRREQLCKITCGEISAISPIAYIAFGQGGLNDDGTVKSPSSTQTALLDPIMVDDGDGGTIAYKLPVVHNITDHPVPTTARYKVTIPAADLAGVIISEAALVDSDGNLCAIRNFLGKGKDGDVEFTFTFDDEF